MDLIRLEGDDLAQFLPSVGEIYAFLSSFSSCNSKNTTYSLLQSQLDSLLFEIVCPLMCFNDNDQTLWDEDPHEYVRKGYAADIIDDLYSPTTADMISLSQSFVV